MPVNSRLKITIFAIMKGLIPCVVLMALSFVCFFISLQLASFVMLIGSFAIFAKNYRRDWVIKWYTCLLPAVISIAAFLIQILFLN